MIKHWCSIDYEQDASTATSFLLQVHKAATHTREYSWGHVFATPQSTAYSTFLVTNFTCITAITPSYSSCTKISIIVFRFNYSPPIRQTFKRKTFKKTDKTQLWKSWDNPLILDKKSHQNKHTASSETGFILKNYFFPLLVSVTKMTCKLLSPWH